MKLQPTPTERWALGLLACVAAITFFFPLISLHVPIAGDQDVSGYDAISKISQFRNQLTSKAEDAAAKGPAHSEGPLPIKQPSLSAVRIPTSVELAWLIPASIVAAFVCSLAALAGSILSWWLSRAASTLGAFCGLAAILHIRIMNSDVHTYLQQLMNVITEDLKGNPFAGLVETVQNLMVNAFQVKPGVGLYTLTVILALAAFIAHSRVLSRLRLAEPSA